MRTQLLLQKIFTKRNRRLDDGFQVANTFRVFRMFSGLIPYPVLTLDFDFLTVIFMPIYVSAKFGVLR